MAEEKGYNGWSNYETWAWKLWIDNDQGSYGYWREAAQECWDDAEEEGSFTREEKAVYALASRLKDEAEEANPVASEASVWADLMGAALSEINWREIAASLIEEADKTEEGPEKEADDESNG